MRIQYPILPRNIEKACGKYCPVNHRIASLPASKILYEQ